MQTVEFVCNWINTRIEQRNEHRPVRQQMSLIACACSFVFVDVQIHECQFSTYTTDTIYHNAWIGNYVKQLTQEIVAEISEGLKTIRIRTASALSKMPLFLIFAMIRAMYSLRYAK